MTMLAKTETIAEETVTVEFNLNGENVVQTVTPRRLLSDLIREDCRLVGTHVGCGEGACGACTILLDGYPARSCTLLAVQAEGTSIVTVEGMNEPTGLNRIQAAFQEHHALQCGYCTPGLLATVSWMVGQRMEPDDELIKAHLAGHLCRCTGYKNILAAVRSLLEQGSSQAASPPATVALAKAVGA
jgi:aerobic carbon-monoxide dehydrogenase small subunit